MKQKKISFWKKNTLNKLTKNNMSLNRRGENNSFFNQKHSEQAIQFIK